MLRLLSRKKSATAAAVAAISGEDNSGGGDPSHDRCEDLGAGDSRPR